MSANNEMLQDPAVLMTSKNPSLTGSGKSRPRYNAGQQLIKSLLSDCSAIANILESHDSATQTAAATNGRVNKPRRRTPRKKNVKSPQSKQNQQHQQQQQTVQSPSLDSDHSDFQSTAAYIDDQENRSPKKKRRNDNRSFKPSNDGRTFKPSNKSSHNSNTSPRSPEPKSQKSDKPKSGNHQSSGRTPLESSVRLLNQQSNSQRQLYKPINIAHNSMANIAPYRRFPISQNPFAQGRYVSELNPFAQSFVPRYTVPKPGTSNEYVSREIADYYQRNRQSNEQFKSKQIMRQGLESILKHGFPQHIINLYMVGSSTNGIGDNGSSVDICIVARKRPLASIGSASVSTAATSTTNDVELEVQSSSENQNLPSVDSTASNASFETASSQVEPSTQQESETKEEAKPEAPQEAVQESVQEKPQDDSAKEVKEEAKAADAVQSVVESAQEQSSTENQSEQSHDAVNEAAKAPEAESSESTLVAEEPPEVSEPTSTGEVTDLSLDMIEKFLQSKNFAKEIVSIPAKVPIIKFKDDITKLSITLNLNQEVSIRNTQLIRDYAKLDWRFPYLALVMKQWAKENRINNALEKTVSNYSWTLMVVHFLQVVDPPVLPCLQKMIPRRYNQANIEQAIHNWRRYPAKWRSNNNMNLRQLLKAMFRYYGYVFSYDQHVISVREGKVLERTDGFASSEDHHSQWNSFLCIEEPFTRTNTARSAHDKEKFERIIELFRMSSNALRGVRISLFNVVADDINCPITY